MFKKHKSLAAPVSPPPPIRLCELKSNSALRIILVAQEMDKTDLAVKSMMIDLLSKVEENLEIDSAKASIGKVLHNFFSLVDKVPVYHCNYIPAVELQIFFNNNIKKSEEEIIQLCSETIQQSFCKKWFTERRLRFSASSNIHNINVRNRKPIDKLVKELLNPSKVSTEATRYGIKNESKARELYKSLFDCEVLEVGTIVAKNNQWLCASSDGIVIKDKTVLKLVEFKCLFNCRDKPVIDFVNKKSNASFLVFKNGEIIFKTSDKYYTQCQVQMYVTGMSECDLFVYSPVKNGSINVTVKRNNEFLQKVISKAELFYFQHFLPALYDETKKKLMIIQVVAVVQSTLQSVPLLVQILAIRIL